MAASVNGAVGSWRAVGSFTRGADHFRATGRKYFDVISLFIRSWKDLDSISEVIIFPEDFAILPGIYSFRAVGLITQSYCVCFGARPLV